MSNCIIKVITKQTVTLTFMILAFVSCKSMQNRHEEDVKPKMIRIIQINNGHKFWINWSNKVITGNGTECPHETDGICLNLATEFMVYDEPYCFANNNDDFISIAIPRYDDMNTTNPQYEMLENLDVLSVCDSMVLWDEETLEILDFTNPIAVLPNDYRINHDNDVLYINLQTAPVNLEQKVCAFFHCNDNIVYSADFHTYYSGFLGKSDILTGIVDEVDDYYLTMVFPLEFNISDAEDMVSHITNNQALEIGDDIICDNSSVCCTLGLRGSFLLSRGRCEVETTNDDIKVKIPYSLLRH